MYTCILMFSRLTLCRLVLQGKGFHMFKVIQKVNPEDFGNTAYFLGLLMFDEGIGL